MPHRVAGPEPDARGLRSRYVWMRQSKLPAGSRTPPGSGTGAARAPAAHLVTRTRHRKCRMSALVAPQMAIQRGQEGLVPSRYPLELRSWLARVIANRNETRLLVVTLLVSRVAPSKYQ